MGPTAVEPTCQSVNCRGASSGQKCSSSAAPIFSSCTVAPSRFPRNVSVPASSSVRLRHVILQSPHLFCSRSQLPSSDWCETDRQQRQRVSGRSRKIHGAKTTITVARPGPATWGSGEAIYMLAVRESLLGQERWSLYTKIKCKTSRQ